MAALFAVLFLSLAGILIGAVYWIVEDTQTSTLMNSIDADINTINNGYREKGLSEAIEVIQQRLGSAEFSHMDSAGGYFLLEEVGTGKLAGNLSELPPKLGLISLPLPKHTTHREHDRGEMLGKGTFIVPGIYLFVGRNTATIAATRLRILYAFAWITGAAFVLAASGGVLFSLQFMRRIDAITRTCEAIVAGRFSDRIQLRGKNDELDRLSSAINSMLDRIAVLLDNLRQVSSDVAHDLRTPLTHLRQRLEEARTKSTTIDDYATAVAQAIDDTDQLLSIFGALLRISQIEAGTRLAAFSPLSLSQLLNRLYEMYRPVAEDHGQVLRREIHDDIHVRGDTELLNQLFINLIENAIRHTSAGTAIIIKLIVANETASASVCDTGPGIATDERDKVFRRFYRVTTSRSTPGNGLGLALAAAIAGLHQSTIDLADNEPGLKVTVALPLMTSGL